MLPQLQPTHTSHHGTNTSQSQHTHKVPFAMYL